MPVQVYKNDINALNVIELIQELRTNKEMFMETIGNREEFINMKNDMVEKSSDIFLGEEMRPNSWKPQKVKFFLKESRI